MIKKRLGAVLLIIFYFLSVSCERDDGIQSQITPTAMSDLSMQIAMTQEKYSMGDKVISEYILTNRSTRSLWVIHRPELVALGAENTVMGGLVIEIIKPSGKKAVLTVRLGKEHIPDIKDFYLLQPGETIEGKIGLSIWDLDESGRYSVQISYHNPVDPGLGEDVWKGTASSNTEYFTIK